MLGTGAGLSLLSSRRWTSRYLAEWYPQDQPSFWSQPWGDRWRWQGVSLEVCDLLDVLEKSLAYTGQPFVAPWQWVVELALPHSGVLVGHDPVNWRRGHLELEDAEVVGAPHDHLDNRLGLLEGFAEVYVVLRLEHWIPPGLASQRPKVDARRRHWHPGHNLIEEAAQLADLGVLAVPSPSHEFPRDPDNGFL